MRMNLLISFSLLVATFGRVEASRFNFTVYDQNPDGCVGPLNQIQDWLEGYTFNVGEKKAAVRCLAPNGDVEDFSGEPCELLTFLRGRESSTFLIAPFGKDFNRFVQGQSSSAADVQEGAENVVKVAEEQLSIQAQPTQKVLDWSPRPREKRAMSVDPSAVSQTANRNFLFSRSSVRFKGDQQVSAPGAGVTSEISPQSRSAFTRSTTSFRRRRYRIKREPHDRYGDLRTQKNYIGSAGDYPFPFFHPQPIIVPKVSLGNLLQRACFREYSEEDNSNQSSNRKGCKKSFDPYTEHDLNWSPREDAVSEYLQNNSGIFDEPAGDQVKRERKSRRNSEQECVYPEGDSSDSDSFSEAYESHSKNSLYGKKSHQRKRKNSK